jgi:hypothetical protein
MKTLRILCLVAAIVIPQLLLAKLPFTNDAFGKLEGILDFCAKADPQSAAKYQEQDKRLVKDLPENELAEARQSQEYKKAYDAVGSELGKEPTDKAAEACAASLEGDKQVLEFSSRPQ